MTKGTKRSWFRIICRLWNRAVRFSGSAKCFTHCQIRNLTARFQSLIICNSKVTKDLRACLQSVQSVASPHSWCFVWFSLGSSGYQLGCTIAAVSAQRPWNLSKIQNITNEGTPPEFRGVYPLTMPGDVIPARMTMATITISTLIRTWSQRNVIRSGAEMRFRPLWNAFSCYGTI